MQRLLTHQQDDELSVNKGEACGLNPLKIHSALEEQEKVIGRCV